MTNSTTIIHDAITARLEARRILSVTGIAKETGVDKTEVGKELGRLFRDCDLRACDAYGDLNGQTHTKLFGRIFPR